MTTQGKNESIESGRIVRVVTTCKPIGLVPNRYAKLLYQYSLSGVNKWYAIQVDNPGTGSISGVIDISQVTFLNKPGQTL